MDNNRYQQRGVSADKEDVHEAIKHLDKGLYPNAFCKVLPDLVAQDPLYCNIMHADTAGTKTSLAYLYWKETGDLSVWKGIAQDAIVMNIDDMACVGAVDQIILSSTIGRNKHLISGDVISALINSTSEFVAEMRQLGVQMTLAGGETADVGDIVRSLDVGFTTFARMARKDVLENNIQDGDVIVGLASFGKASYEHEPYNGGMGSNGLTSARHDVLSSVYSNKYPESFDPNTPASLVYSGSKNLLDTVHIDGYGDITIGKLILSPTRTYIPILADIFKNNIPVNGMIHCSGGAQTKVKKFVSNRKIIKDQLFEIPPLFDIIEKESNTARKEMYKVFNMGHRMEVYCKPDYAQSIIDISKSYNVDAKIIGYVENYDGESVEIKDSEGTYIYN